MFLKNRELRIKLDKTLKNEKTTPTTVEECIGEATAAVMKDVAVVVLKRAAITVGAIIVLSKAMDIIGEVIVKKTESADNK